MSTITVRSEEARLKWRDTLDHAYQGGEVVIERYNKPAAVVVGYAQWQAIMEIVKMVREDALRSDLQRAKARVASGESGFVSHSELKQQIMERTRRAPDHAAVGN
jgi:prevent-host-death family protein